jgi:putative ABC transport system substrate-binding protein
VHRAHGAFRRRREPGMHVVVVAVWACVTVFGAYAQDVRKPLRVAVLNEGSAATHPAVEGLKAGLRERGFAEGADVAFEIRFTQGDADETRRAAAAIAQAGADLIFTSGEGPTRSAIAATTTIPIVFTLVRDPVAENFVVALAQPGRNATGVANLTTQLAGKRLELLKTLVPTATRVWAIHDGADPVCTRMVAHAREAALRLGLELVSRPVTTKAELIEALDEVDDGDALLAPDGGRFDVASAILDASLARRMPAVFATALYVGYGGLASYGSDYYAEGFQAARMVERILRGARAQDLPVEAADGIDLAINLNTATRLGIVVPRKVLLRADTIRR